MIGLPCGFPSKASGQFPFQDTTNPASCGRKPGASAQARPDLKFTKQVLCLLAKGRVPIHPLHVEARRRDSFSHIGLLKSTKGMARVFASKGETPAGRSRMGLPNEKTQSGLRIPLP